LAEDKACGEVTVMKVVVVYESMFGNLRTVVEAVAEE